MALDSTMNFEISGPGGGSGAPSTKDDTTLETNIGSVPSLNSSPAKNNVPSVGKPETSDIINTRFYEDVSGNPGTLDSTLSDVLEISFNK